MWTLCWLSVKGDWCLQKQFVALLWVWLGSYSKHYLNSFHQLMFTANLIFCLGGKKETEGEKDLRSSGCTCKHPTACLNSLSEHHSHLSLYLWYLPLYLNFQPKRAPNSSQFKGPLEGTNQQWESDFWGYTILWHYIMWKIKRAWVRGRKVFCGDSFPLRLGNTRVSWKMVGGTQVPIGAAHTLEPWDDAGILWERSISSMRGWYKGSDLWGESHRVRSSDHRGCVLSVKTLNCVTPSVCTASFPLQRDSIDITALFLKCEQRHAYLAQHRHVSRIVSLLCLSDLPPVENSLYFPGVWELVKTREANIKKFAVYIHFLPSFSVDLGKFPKHIQSSLCFSAPLKVRPILRIARQLSPHSQPFWAVGQLPPWTGSPEV